jgi:uncharacterized membrane protein
MIILLKILKILTLFIVLDIPYLLLTGSHWGKQINKIQKSKLKLNYTGVFLSYLFLSVGLLIFVLPNIKKDNKFNDSLKYGALYGMVIYGVFNGTNLAIFKNYKITTLLLDTIWGSLLCFMVTYLLS